MGFCVFVKLYKETSHTQRREKQQEHQPSSARKKRGENMPNKQKKQRAGEKKTGDFSFRMKIGEDEVEVSGTREDVNKTLENLPNLVPHIHKAFEDLKPKTVATLTVKTEAQQKTATDETAQIFPKIATTSNVVEAVIKVLETDWGKWRPRTEQELREAIKSSGLKFSDHALSQTLEGLAKKGLVRRWNTNTGFVYILAEAKELSFKEEQK
jgi:predicted flavoprotein YhiN